MTKVPLRAYIKEIETIIEQKQTEEAIAHCRHILQTFPKHVDTYRMLGKAYLESKRYSNSADIFQRVLSAVPDDFVSHVGMSIIREDENNLDAAISHMERAFEGQPYNAAIQGELRRLYGRRDGMEPPKIHLTQGALARMYVKGNLYQQAIAELRAAIADDPQRFDLRVLLAQMYTESDDYAKAIETAGSIIAKLPYCLVANRILALSLEKTERAKEAAGYKKQLIELDPYEAFVGPNTPSVSNIPPQAVMVEQLIWDGGPAVSSLDQPEWAIAAGVDFTETEPSSDGLPDWISETEDEFPALPGSIAEDRQSDDIPDWMQAAGWGPSTGEFDESQTDFSLDEDEIAEESASAEAVAGNIPDWLQEMAPPGAIEDPDEVADAPFDFPGSEISESDSTNWLDEVTETTESDLPDWLKPAAIGAGAAIVGALSEDSESVEDDEETLNVFESSADQAEDIPAWLDDLGSEDSEALEPDLDFASEELPDWLQENEEGPSVVEGETEESDDMFDWLQETGTDKAPSSEIASQPAPTTDDIPEWLQDVIEDEPVAPDIESSATTAGSGEIPDWLSGVLEEDVTDSRARAESDEIPDWLQGEIEEADEQAAEVEETEIPDWLQNISDEALPAKETPNEEDHESASIFAATAAAAGAALLAHEDDATEDLEEEGLTTEFVTDEPLDWLTEGSEETNLVSESTEEQLPDWLQETSVEAAEPEMGKSELETFAEEVEAQTATLPDWLQEVYDEEDPFVESEELETEAKTSAIPDWLQDVDEKDDQTGEDAEAQLPDWLHEVTEDESDTVETPESLSGMVTATETISEIEEVISEETSLDEITEEAPDWIQEVLEDESIEKILEDRDAEPVTKIAEADEIPDWLQEVVDETHPDLDLDEDDLEEIDSGGLPDWLLEAETFSKTTEETLEEIPTTFTAEENLEWIEEIGADGFDKDADGGDSEILTTEAEIEEIPDWLQEPTDEFAPASETEESIDADHESEIPDWIKEMVSDEESMESDDSASEETKDDETESAESGAAGIIAAGVSGAVIAGAAALAAEDNQDEVDADAELLIDSTQPFEKLGQEVGEIESELPGWLQDIPDSEPIEYATAESPQDDEIPAWLQDIGDDIPTIAGETEVSRSIPSEPELDDIPDWMQDIAEEETILADVDATPADSTSLEFSDADAAMAWLESLAAKQGVSEDELLTSPEQRSEIQPEWVQEASAETVENSETTDEVIPEWLSDPVTEIEEGSFAQIQESVPVEEAELIFDQIETIEDEVELTPEQPVEPQIDIPDWLQEMEEEPPLDAAEIAPEEAGILAEIPEITPPADTPEKISLESKTEEMTDFEDVDAAMAWLESLAAKQGVAEEELLTKPEQRRETPPDWVQESIDAEMAARSKSEEPFELVDEPSFESQDGISDWILDAPKTPAQPELLQEEIAVETVETEQTEAQETEEIDIEDADAAMAWLESLAANQGVSEDELITSPDERPTTPPDWIQEISVETETTLQTETEPEVAEDFSEWIAKVPETEELETISDFETTDSADDIDFADSDAAMAWLESLAAKQGVSEEELLTNPEDRPDAPPDWVQAETRQAELEAESLSFIQAAEDIATEQPSIPEIPESEISLEPPSWISDGDIPEDDDYSWLSPDVSEAISAEAETQIDLNEASLIQLERLPGVGFRRAQALTAYRDEYGNFSNFDELYNVPGLDEETIEILKNSVKIKSLETAAVSEIPAEEALFTPPETEPEDELHQQQIEAQTKLMNGDFAGAMEGYDALIQKGQRLDQVIEDLQKASEQYPREISLLQKLGDACLRADRLQEALEAYAKAEDLFS